MTALVRPTPNLPVIANDTAPLSMGEMASCAMLVHVPCQMMPLVGLKRFPNCEGLYVTEAIAMAGWDLDYNTVLLRDGVMVKRAEWDARVIAAGELVVLVTVAHGNGGGGGGGASKIIALVATIALAVFAPQIAVALLGKELAATAILGGLTTWGGLATVGIVLAGGTLISALLPKPASAANDAANALSAATSPTYSLSASTNQARLNQPIPEWFGRMRVTVDLTTRPYFDFVDNDQELKQVFGLGIGTFDIEEYGVADTPIFKDGAATGNYPEMTVLVMQPGEPNTLFSDNVKTSDDVSNIEMLGTNEDGYGWSGPYVLNDAGTQAWRAEFDVGAPGGLFAISTNNVLQPIGASFRVEVQAIDEAGNPGANPWQGVIDTTLSQATRDPIRKTFGVALGGGRYQVRFHRTNAKSTDLNAQDQIAMMAMRAFLPNSVTPGDTTRIAILARSTKNLNGNTAQQFYVIATRKLPLFNTVTQTWGLPAATRSIAAAAAYVCYAQNGLARDDNEIDLMKLFYTLHPIWEARGDHFDGVFDTSTPGWTALQNILRVGRAEPLRMGRVITFNRDEPKEAYSGAFSPANILPGSFNIDYLNFDDNSVDALWISFFDARTWKQNTVFCALPDSTMDPDSAPTVDMTLGITDRDQAWREGMFMVACNRWRRTFPQFRTRLEGRATFRGAKILVSHWMPGKWGASARVLYLEEHGDGDVVTLSEPWAGVNDLGDATKVITLITPDGQPWGPVPFTLLDDGALTGALQAKLLEPFDLAEGKYAGMQPRDWGVWDGDGLDFERPRAFFGTAENKALDAIVMSMKPEAGRNATVTCVIDDPRVHYADGTIPPLEGDTPEPPTESTSPRSRTKENLTITAVTFREIPQGGGVLTSPQANFSVIGAPDALIFDAKWKWNPDSDTQFTPITRGFARSLSIPSVTGTLVMQIRAEGASGFGDWFEVSVVCQGIPPAPDAPDGSLTVTQDTGWVRGTTDGSWHWTAVGAAISYSILIQYQAAPDLTWHDGGAGSTTDTSITVSQDAIIPNPTNGVIATNVRIGVKAVFANGAAPDFTFP